MSNKIAINKHKGSMTQFERELTAAGVPEHMKKSKGGPVIDRCKSYGLWFRTHRHAEFIKMYKTWAKNLEKNPVAA